MSEMKYMFGLILSPIDNIKQFSEIIIDTKYDKVLTDFYGTQVIMDISVASIEEKLKNIKK
jgi:hypothetical protein